MKKAVTLIATGLIIGALAYIMPYVFYGVDTVRGFFDESFFILSCLGFVFIGIGLVLLSDNVIKFIAVNVTILFMGLFLLSYFNTLYDEIINTKWYVITLISSTLITICLRIVLPYFKSN